MLLPSRSLVVNRDELHSLSATGMTMPDASARRNGGAPRTRLVPQLVIDDPTYAPNLFFEGLHYASARLRQVLDLSSDNVRYGPAACVACSALARAAEYMTLEPLLIADPIDQDRSDGEWITTFGPGEVQSRLWVPLGGPSRPAPRIAIRSDFTPPAAMFGLRHSGELVVTDELADRILASGIPDVVLVRLGQERGQMESVFKRA